MAWRRKDHRDSASREIQIYSTGQGLLVEGSPTAVTGFIDKMMTATKAAGGQGRHLIVNSVIEGTQAAANIAAVGRTHREYLEFSPKALALLKQHGAIPTGQGWFRSFVHDGKQLAGHLDWKPANLGPEQALSLQALAGQMALRAAVHDIVAAIKRVENKIDQIADLAKAERLGAVTADRATLTPMVERLRAIGQLSTTDWSSIASLGPWIARDIETLRVYIVQQLDRIGDSRLVRNRAADAEDLTDQLVAESLALLVLAEQNYALWQELRIGHAAVHERNALHAVTSDALQQLDTLTQADQALVHQLCQAVTQLTNPTGYEGLAPLKKRQLTQHAHSLANICTWFAHQRHLDHDHAELPDYPGLGASLSKVGHTITAPMRIRSRGVADVEPAASLPAGETDA
jgi:hypothetical protein